jgi:sulfur-carrier protein
VEQTMPDTDTVTVLIPTALRPQAGNQESVDVSGATIGQVLGSLTGQYPDLGKRLYKDGKELNRFINIYVNDEDIRFLDNLDTAVKAGDEVSIVPAIAGG